MEGIDGARMDVPVGSVVVWDNDTLAWLRVMLPQIPALTHLPAYDFLDASHPSTAPVPSHEEQNTVIKAYVTPSALEAARPFDGVFESETKLLLTTALSDTKLSKAVTDRDVEDLIDHVCDEHTRLARVEDVCAHFRAARRSRIDGDKKRKERELVSRLLALISNTGSSVSEWYESMVQASGPGGKVTKKDVENAVRHLRSYAIQNRKRGFQFQEDEIITIHDALVRGGAGEEIPYTVIETAFEQAETAQGDDPHLNRVHRSMRVIEDAMKKKGIRMEALMQWIDHGTLNALTSDELREGLAMIVDAHTFTLPQRSSRDQHHHTLRVRRFRDWPVTIDVHIQAHAGGGAAASNAHRLALHSPLVDMDALINATSMGPDGRPAIDHKSMEQQPVFLDAADDEINAFLRALGEFVEAKQQQQTQQQQQQQLEGASEEPVCDKGKGAASKFTVDDLRAYLRTLRSNPGFDRTSSFARDLGRMLQVLESEWLYMRALEYKQRRARGEHLGPTEGEEDDESKEAARVCRGFRDPPSPMDVVQKDSFLRLTSLDGIERVLDPTESEAVPIYRLACVLCCVLEHKRASSHQPAELAEQCNRIAAFVERIERPEGISTQRRGGGKMGTEGAGEMTIPGPDHATSTKQTKWRPAMPDDMLFVSKSIFSPDQEASGSTNSAKTNGQTPRIPARHMENHFRRARRLRQVEKSFRVGMAVAERLFKCLREVNVNLDSCITTSSGKAQLENKKDLVRALEWISRKVKESRDVEDARKREEEAEEAYYRQQFLLTGGEEEGSTVEANATATQTPDEKAHAQADRDDDVIWSTYEVDALAELLQVCGRTGQSHWHSQTFRHAFEIIAEHRIAKQMALLGVTEEDEHGVNFNTVALLPTEPLVDDYSALFMDLVKGNDKLRVPHFIWHLESTMLDLGLRFVDLFGGTASSFISPKDFEKAVEQVLSRSNGSSKEAGIQASAPSSDASVAPSASFTSLEHEQSKRRALCSHMRQSEALWGIMDELCALVDCLTRQGITCMDLLACLTPPGASSAPLWDISVSVPLAKVHAVLSGVHRTECQAIMRVFEENQPVEDKRRPMIVELRDTYASLKGCGAATVLDLLVCVENRGEMESFLDSLRAVHADDAAFISDHMVCEHMERLGYRVTLLEAQRFVEFVLNSRLAPAVVDTEGVGVGLGDKEGPEEQPRSEAINENAGDHRLTTVERSTRSENFSPSGPGGEEEEEEEEEEHVELEVPPLASIADVTRVLREYKRLALWTHLLSECRSIRHVLYAYDIHAQSGLTAKELWDGFLRLRGDQVVLSQPQRKACHKRLLTSAVIESKLSHAAHPSSDRSSLWYRSLWSHKSQAVALKLAIAKVRRHVELEATDISRALSAFQGNGSGRRKFKKYNRSTVARWLHSLMVRPGMAGAFDQLTVGSGTRHNSQEGKGEGSAKADSGEAASPATTPTPGSTFSDSPPADDEVSASILGPDLVPSLVDDAGVVALGTDVGSMMQRDRALSTESMNSSHSIASTLREAAEAYSSRLEELLDMLIEVSGDTTNSLEVRVLLSVLRGNVKAALQPSGTQSTPTLPSICSTTTPVVQETPQPTYSFESSLSPDHIKMVAAYIDAAVEDTIGGNVVGSEARRHPQEEVAPATIGASNVFAALKAFKRERSEYEQITNALGLLRRVRDTLEDNGMTQKQWLRSLGRGTVTTVVPQPEKPGPGSAFGSSDLATPASTASTTAGPVKAGARSGRRKRKEASTLEPEEPKPMKLKSFNSTHLRHALRFLCDKTRCRAFSESEIIVLLRFLESKKGEGSFTKGRIQRALGSEAGARELAREHLMKRKEAKQMPDQILTSDDPVGQEALGESEQAERLETTLEAMAAFTALLGERNLTAAEFLAHIRLNARARVTKEEFLRRLRNWALVRVAAAPCDSLGTLNASTMDLGEEEQDGVGDAPSFDAAPSTAAGQQHPHEGTLLDVPHHTGSAAEMKLLLSELTAGLFRRGKRVNDFVRAITQFQLGLQEGPGSDVDCGSMSDSVALSTSTPQAPTDVRITKEDVVRIYEGLIRPSTAAQRFLRRQPRSNVHYRTRGRSSSLSSLGSVASDATFVNGDSAVPGANGSTFASTMEGFRGNGVGEVLLALDEMVRRTRGGFNGMFSFVGPSPYASAVQLQSEEEGGGHRDGSGGDIGTRFLSPEEMHIAVARLKIKKLNKKGVGKLVEYLSVHHTASPILEGSGKRSKQGKIPSNLIPLAALEKLVTTFRRWTVRQEQRSVPLLSGDEQHMLVEYLVSGTKVGAAQLKRMLKIKQNHRSSQMSAIREVAYTSTGEGAQDSGATDHPSGGLLSPDPASGPSVGASSSSRGHVHLQVRGEPQGVVFVIGCPGSGKSVAAQAIANHLGWEVLDQNQGARASGAADPAQQATIPHEEVAEDASIPAELVVSLLLKAVDHMNELSYIRNNACPAGFVVEGFPSNRASAELWQRRSYGTHVVAGVLVLSCSRSHMEARLTDRESPAKIKSRIENWGRHVAPEVAGIGVTFYTRHVVTDGTLANTRKQVVKLFDRKSVREKIVAGLGPGFDDEEYTRRHERLDAQAVLNDGDADVTAKLRRAAANPSQQRLEEEEDYQLGPGLGMDGDRSRDCDREGEGGGAGVTLPRI